MSADPMRAGFEAVSSLVKSWKLGDYVHHVRHLKDNGMSGQEFLVIFSIPQPTQPVPGHTAQAYFTVKLPPEGDEDDDPPPPKIKYRVETQQQTLDGSLPIRKVWLDAAIRRKRKVLGDSRMFANESKLPAPVAFMPGQYKADAAVVDSAMMGYDENQERLLEAMADLGDAQGVAAMNAMESVAELEQLLVHVFTEADKDGNGYLDRQEFFALLDTAELGLDSMEKHQLMMLCDVNDDGRIEYSEFTAFGADVIQTMRMRKLNADETAVLEAKAELDARTTLHSLGAEEVTAALLQAFKDFDADGSGRLERAEIVKCLQSLTLGATKLTQREVRMIMSYIDEDGSGTIEYNEFAPLMFNWMVEALKIGFLASEASELEEYLLFHCLSYDFDGAGLLDYDLAKRALFEIDVVRMTPIQVHSCLADADFDDNGRIDVRKWVPAAARLMSKFCDPTLEHKRATVSKMAKITPLQALTVDERQRLETMAAGVFAQYDADKSGKLDRAEFEKCLTESKLGFSTRQIAHMMAAADVSADGLIDYKEFSALFNCCILELARADAIEKMLEAEAAAESLPYDLMLLLDELMIPLHIAFDIASEGESGVDTPKLVELISLKGPEWGLGSAAVSLVGEQVATLGDKVEWPALVECIERLVEENK